jgi:hypothetical protein
MPKNNKGKKKVPKKKHPKPQVAVDPQQDSTNEKKEILLSPNWIVELPSDVLWKTLQFMPSPNWRNCMRVSKWWYNQTMSAFREHCFALSLKNPAIINKLPLLPKLTSLTVQKNKGVRDDISYLADLKSLQHLDIAVLNMFETAPTIAKLSNLTELRVNIMQKGGPALDFEHVLKLCELLPKLQNLQIDHRTKVNFKSSKSVITQVTSLELITSISEFKENPFENFPNLRILNFEVDPNQFAFPKGFTLSKLTKLESIRFLPYAGGGISSLFKGILGITKLHIFNISLPSLPEQDQLPLLKELAIQVLPRNGFPKKGYTSIQKLTYLFEEQPVFDPEYDLFRSCVNLNDLEIISFKNPFGLMWNKLCAMTQLTRLKISGETINLMPAIGKLVNLRIFDLTGPLITEPAAFALTNLNKLETLKLEDTYKLPGEDLMDQMIAALCVSLPPSLTHFLYSGDMSKKVLKVLSKQPLPYLKRLQLKKIDVHSSAALPLLNQSFPHCHTEVQNKGEAAQHWETHGLAELAESLGVEVAAVKQYLALMGQGVKLI